MAALFIALLIAACLLLWFVTTIGAAFRRYDRNVRRSADTYDFVAERRRRIERGGFKSRAGIR